MGTKSRETVYGASVRAAVERAAEARKADDQLACEEFWQVRENRSGKTKTFKAVKNGKEVSVIVDSFSQIKKLQ
jgi:hypothetical protein